MAHSLEYTTLETIEDGVSCLRGAYLAGKRCLFLPSFFLYSSSSLGKSRELYWRKYHLQRLHDLIKQNEDRFYEALANDMKKPRLEAFVGDISPVLEECVYFLDVSRTGFAGIKLILFFFFFFGHCRTLIGL